MTTDELYLDDLTAFDKYLMDLLPDLPPRWRKPRLAWGVSNPANKTVKWEYRGHLLENDRAGADRAAELDTMTYPYEYESAAYFERWLTLYYDQPVTLVGVYVEKRRWFNQTYYEYLLGFRWDQGTIGNPA